MGLLDGKTALIFGVANDHSIAWGIARALHDEGAEVGFQLGREPHRASASSPSPIRSGRRSWSPATSSPTSTSRRVFARWGETHESLDILVHALAFARREDLEGDFVDTSREGFALAIDVSAYSLVALTRAARPLPAPGLVGPDALLLRGREGRVATTTSWASPRPRSRRRSATSPRTWADRRPGQRDQCGPGPDAGRGRDRRLQEDVWRVRATSHRSGRTSRPRTSGGRAVYLASDLSSAVTGEVIYVDGGFSIMGVPISD